VFTKKYGVVLFDGAVQLKLFPETKIKPFKKYCGTAQIEGAVNMVCASRVCIGW